MLSNLIHTQTMPWRAYALLLLLCVAFFIPGIATLPPTDRDESWFAQATKQMVETGDYTDIRYRDAPRYKKPIGIYWLQAASVKLFNPDHLNEIWAYRLPSVISATIAVLLTAALGALLFNAATGLLGGMMLASCLVLVAEAHLAKTDATLLATVMGSIYTMARAYRVPKSGIFNAMLFWVALAAGVLVKGPIILLILGTMLVWLRWREGNIAWFKHLHPLLGAPLACMLILPWFMAINLASHGAFTQQAGGRDFLSKIFRGADGRGVLPPGIYALAFPATFFPFSIFSLYALPDAWKNRRDPALQFLFAWLAPTWVLFELSLSKLPHYVLPLYPAIALLTAKFTLDGFPALAGLTRRWFPTLTTCLWLIIGLALAALFGLAPYVIDRAVAPWQLVAGCALMLAQTLGLAFLLQKKLWHGSLALTLGALLFTATVFGSTLPNLKHLWMSREIVRAARAVAPCAELKIVSAGYQEPSLVFLTGTDTKLVPNGPYAMAELQGDPCRVAIIAKPLLRQFLMTPYDYDAMPRPVGEPLHGLNIGRTEGNESYLYTLPPEPVTP